MERDKVRTECNADGWITHNPNHQIPAKLWKVKEMKMKKLWSAFKVSNSTFIWVHSVTNNIDKFVISQVVLATIYTSKYVIAKVSLVPYNISQSII